MIKKGELVWLKSGGPSMTACESCTKGTCTCIWFLHGEVQKHQFDLETLTKEDPFLVKNDQPILNHHKA
jgi:uncharacterized protein YodC (DUF2158 family)